MKILTPIIREFLDGGFMAAITSALIIFISATLQGLSFNGYPYIFAFLTGLFIYSIDQFIDRDYKNVYFAWIKLLIIALLFIFLWQKANITFVIYNLVILCLGLSYDIYFKKITKKIVGFKNYFVSIMFALLIPFPLVFENHTLTLSFWLVFLFFVARMFVNTSFCDIKDIDQDKKANLLTLPATLGIKKFRTLWYFINLLSVFPIFFGVYLNTLPLYSIGFVLLLPFSFYYFSKYKDTKISVLIADSEPIIWILVVIIGGKLGIY